MQRLRMAVIHKVSSLRNAEVARGYVEFLGRQQLRQLIVRPAVEFPLVAFAVGVLGGIESAVGMRHVAQDVGEDVARRVRVPDVAADEVGVQIKLRELGIIVEHLLEMRNEPVGVHGITREAAAELIADAASGHRLACVQDHPLCFVVLESFRAAQQERWLARLRKFWRAPKTAVLRIVSFLEHRARATQNFRRQANVRRGRIGGGEFQTGVNFIRRRRDIAAPLPPDGGNLSQHGTKTAAAVPVIRREIGAAEKRLAVGRQENIQRPAARAGGALHECHVNLVHVRSLLAVHLDADEMLVENFGGRFALERFPLHDVTPVTRRVADAEEDGFVFGLRFRERLVAPGKPVDGVVRVLEEVGRFLAREVVGKLVRGGGSVGRHNGVRLISAWLPAARGQRQQQDQRKNICGCEFHPGRGQA